MIICCLTFLPPCVVLKLWNDLVLMIILVRVGESTTDCGDRRATEAQEFKPTNWKREE